MPRAFRSKLLALLLLLLTPGLGGWVVQSVHPCPTSMPWLAGAGAAEHQHGSHHGAPGQPGETTSCRCFGSCHQGTPATAPAAPTVVVRLAPHAPAAILPARSRLPGAGRTPELHPPATAPPVFA